MSNYFENFPKVLYLFGDEEEPVLFQKLTQYVELIDTIRDDQGAYIEYEIRDGDRPDTLSYKLYGKSEYDWTFFLMNERLRETGWPKDTKQLYEYAQNTLFPNYTAKLGFQERDSADARTFAKLYPVGQDVLVQGSQGVVVRKNVDLGEMTISSDSDITGKSAVTYADGTNLYALSGIAYEYQGIHHYEDDSENWVDFFYQTDSAVGGLGKIPITNLEFLEQQNTDSRRIRVIKKEYIEKVVGEFKRLLERV
jgi:hypothetical protein